MSASGTRIAAAVIALTTLICVVVVAGDEPIRGDGMEEPYVPTPADLREVGVITDEFPVPGALPPEIYPAEAWGVSPPGPPAWLPWALVAIALSWLGGQLARELAGTRIGRPRWRLRAAPDEPPPPDLDDDATGARRAVAVAPGPPGEPADARAAVIEAYARMEQVLAERELGRRASEAPREFLRRVLVERGAPEASLMTLTSLFEEARFSRHPVTESEAREAQRELRAVRRAMS